ncbi:hypothetical protein [Pseudoponticoccus marisrubri]|uniref:Uncharacterized protein n=1 Tax=Pseudoponticoccus marisrubri TaxID=1685382 RepID=A0A0W7WPP1_9RHOB|nr:hypothetical protein [Pseudoponticoccus marisrubri]KUF12555.1 hypothetical protein AVJ23_02170 [Pseudoponticoccus marisrubri]
MSRSSLVDRLTGSVLLLVTLVVIAEEWGAPRTGLREALPLLILALFAGRIAWSRLAYLVLGAGLTLLLVLGGEDWTGPARAGLTTAGFIAAFFTALTILKTVAEGSEAMRRAGRFLASQPPGRRYLALTVGGQGFTLLLNYGALQLLSTLALTSAEREPDPEIRAIRIKRMLLAIERGLVSTLPWSPLSFAVAISTAVVPGTSWAQIVLPSLVTCVLLAGTGWALDTVLKPKLSGPRPPRMTPEGSWASMTPLLVLLAILMISVLGLNGLTGVRIVGVVCVVVPLMAIVWLYLQNRGSGPGWAVLASLRRYLWEELPAFRGELVLLMMAGYIGTVGAALLAPWLVSMGFDLNALPPWVILVALVWVIPAMGQLGMNPILGVTLIAPLLPTPEALGITPVAKVIALTAGWALAGASSPFTATNLLVGRYAGHSALYVGMRWNGLFVLLSGLLLSGWVLAYGYLF